MPVSDIAWVGKPYEGRLGRFATVSVVIYLMIYCFESPVRYLLYKVHASPLILARDALIDVPILLMFTHQALQRKLNWAFLWFLGVLAIEGPIMVVNFGYHGLLAAGFGVKLVINVVIGLLIGRALLVPDRWLYRLFAAVLVVSLLGVIIEKLGGNFPWVGVHDTIGGSDIELSRDWQNGDPLLRRVGGFFRLSIAAAMGIAILAITVASRVRMWSIRCAVLLPSFLCIAMTTQKGAIAAIGLVAMALLSPRSLVLPALRTLVVAGAFFNATLPLFTHDMDIAQGKGGVASAMSFVMRIKTTWPSAWAWVNDHSLFPFGVGMGGMGIPLKLVDPTAWMFPDNMFIIMWAYFGIFAIFFYFVFCYSAWRSFRIDAAEAEPGLAALAMVLLYGIVISILEDQFSAIYLGASASVLLSANCIRKPISQAQSADVPRHIARA